MPAQGNSGKGKGVIERPCLIGLPVDPGEKGVGGSRYLPRGQERAQGKKRKVIETDAIL